MDVTECGHRKTDHPRRAGGSIQHFRLKTTKHRQRGVLRSMLPRTIRCSNGLWSSPRTMGPWPRQPAPLPTPFRPASSCHHADAKHQTRQRVALQGYTNRRISSHTAQCQCLLVIGGRPGTPDSAAEAEYKQNTAEHDNPHQQWRHSGQNAVNTELLWCE